MKKLEEVPAPAGSGEPSAKKQKIDSTSGPENSTLAVDLDREINLDVTSTSDSSSSGEELEDDNDILISSTHDASNKSKKKYSSSPHLSLMNCIALCYLGLLYSEQTVLLVDIAR